MVDERAHLAQVERHISGAKERLRQQEQLIERLAAKGYNINEAQNLLEALKGTLDAFECQRLLIRDQLQL
jgi:hypothetical protein